MIIIIISFSLSLSHLLTHAHTHTDTGPRPPKEFVYLARLYCYTEHNTMYYYDVTVEVDIFVRICYSILTEELTLCGLVGGRVVEIVGVLRGWGSLDCCSVEVRPAGR